MHFSDNQIFHIYNQGNNKCKIFLEERNYSYFMWKMRGYLLPFGDIIAWCLMPNHFHWLFYVKDTEIQRSKFREHVDKTEWERRQAVYGSNARKVEIDHYRIADAHSHISLNESIGKLQQSYTRAINEQEGWTGSLFRKNCKAKDGWKDECNKIAFNSFNNNNDYVAQCLFYIHQNPVKAKLVSTDTEWEYSSAREYFGLNKFKLANTNLGRRILAGYSLV